MSNISEDVWPFICDITPKSVRQYEIAENAFLSDRDLFSACFHSRFVLITPYPVSQDLIYYYHTIIPNSLIASLHPQIHTGQLCQDIINDPILIKKIKQLSSDYGTIKLVSVSSSPQFYQLYQYLQKQGIKIKLAQAPKPDSAWTVDFFGSKSGIRQTLNLIKPPPSVSYSPGCIATSPSIALNLVKNLYSKNRGLVIKTNKGHAGAGILIYPPNQHSLTSFIKDLSHHFAAEKYWAKYPIIIEDYIHLDTSLAGGCPSLEYLIHDDGQFEFLYDGGMRVTSDGVFQGMEISQNIIPKKYRQSMISTGHQVAALYSSMGYRGFFDIDFAIDSQKRIFITESNVRKTGGTHVYVLAKKLFGSNFLSKTYILSNNLCPIKKGWHLKPLLHTLSPLLFNPSTKTGMIVISQNSLAYDRLGYIVFAPDKTSALRIETKAIKLLS